VEGYVVVTRIRNINIVQWALVSALIYAAFGLILGLFWIPFAALMTVVGSGVMRGGGSGGGMMGAGLGFFAIIVFPIMYFVIGFVIGIIFSALYNLVAGWTGGVEMKLETVSTAGGV
jgi:hypothetical protein